MNSRTMRESRGGILDELLRTPVFKDIIRGGVRSLAHADGGGAVKTLMNRDPEVFLTLASATPAMANVFIRAFTELGVQLKSQYPPSTLASFAGSMLGDIDTSSLKECIGVWKELLGSMLLSSPETLEVLTDRVLSTGPALAAQGVDALSRALNGLEKARPGAASAFLATTLDRLDRPAASNALCIAVGAVLDQKWHVLSWFFRFIRARVRRRFGS